MQKRAETPHIAKNVRYTVTLLNAAKSNKLKPENAYTAAHMPKTIKFAMQK